jgi:hypothetical protein
MERPRQVEGSYSLVSGSLSYGLALARISLVANGATSGRLYSRRNGEW